MENKYYVYTHTVNGTIFYVGKGTGNRAYQTKSRNRHWWNIVKKYGNPTVTIIKENLSEDESFKIEGELIKEIGIENLSNVIEFGSVHNGNYDKYGKNNPMFGKKHTNEAKKKISKAKKGVSIKKPSNFGKKISEKLKGKRKSKKHIKSMSIAQKNIKPKECPHCGKIGTHNMKRYHFDNCKLVNKGQTNSFKTATWKGYLIVEDLDGNETKYNSMAEASRKLKVDIHSISNFIKNKTTFKRGIYKDYKFRLTDE